MFDELKSRMNKFWNDDRTLAQTDPEFIELFSNFAYDEVVNEPGANHPDLDDATRSMAILAALIGCQGLDDFELMVPVAFESGVGAVQVKEIVYQAVAYLGFGRVLPFLKKTNEILEAKNIHLPLEPQSTTTPETRAEAGEQAQIDIFGERMRGFAQSGPEKTRHLNKWPPASSIIWVTVCLFPVKTVPLRPSPCRICARNISLRSSKVSRQVLCLLW